MTSQWEFVCCLLFFLLLLLRCFFLTLSIETFMLMSRHAMVSTVAVFNYWNFTWEQDYASFDFLISRILTVRSRSNHAVKRFGRKEMVVSLTKVQQVGRWSQVIGYNQQRIHCIVGTCCNVKRKWCSLPKFLSGTSLKVQPFYVSGKQWEFSPI